VKEGTTMIEPHPAQRPAQGPQSGVQPMIELLQVLVEGQAQLAETQQELRGLVERIIKAIEAHATPAPKGETPAPVQPKIATYEQMYGPILPAPEPRWKPLPPPRRRHWLARWLVREETR